MHSPVRCHSSDFLTSFFSLQAFQQLHAHGKISKEDVLVMTECCAYAHQHWSALQLLRDNSSSVAAMPTSMQSKLFYAVLESISLQNCSSELLLELLAVGMRQQTPSARRQASDLILDCIKGQEMQLVKQVTCCHTTKQPWHPATAAGCRPLYHAHTNGLINIAARCYIADTGHTVRAQCYQHIPCCIATPHAWLPLHLYSAWSGHTSCSHTCRCLRSARSTTCV